MNRIYASMSMCHQPYLNLIMKFNQRERLLLGSLRTSNRQVLDPFDFQPALALHEAGLAELTFDQSKKATYLSRTTAGRAVQDSLDK